MQIFKVRWCFQINYIEKNKRKAKAFRSDGMQLFFFLQILSIFVVVAVGGKPTQNQNQNTHSHLS